MSRKSRPKIPDVLPAVAASIHEPELQVNAPVIDETERDYQIEQETVVVMDAVCPRCGSPERDRLREISPRIYTHQGCVIRYRTKCLGRINPVDKDGKPVVDKDGNPVSYECGNRYKIKKLVPRAKPNDRKSAS